MLSRGSVPEGWIRLRQRRVLPQLRGEPPTEATESTTVHYKTVPTKA